MAWLDDSRMRRSASRLRAELGVGGFDMDGARSFALDLRFELREDVAA